MANRPNTPNHSLNEEAVSKIIDNQTRQLDLQEKELQLRAIDIEKGYNYSEKALAVQEKVILAEQSSNNKESTKQYVFALGFAALVIIPVVILALNGQSKLAENMLNVIVPVVTGLGGYHLGTRKRNSEKTNTP
jgi:hypothetical protein